MTRLDPQLLRACAAYLVHERVYGSALVSDHLGAIRDCEVPMAIARAVLDATPEMLAWWCRTLAAGSGIAGEEKSSPEVFSAEEMAGEWLDVLHRMAMGLPVTGTSELTRCGYAVFDPEHGYWHATDAGLIALGNWLSDGRVSDAAEPAAEYHAEGDPPAALLGVVQAHYRAATESARAASTGDRLHPDCAERGECYRDAHGPGPGCEGVCLRLQAEQRRRADAEQRRASSVAAALDRVEAKCQRAGLLGVKSDIARIRSALDMAEIAALAEATVEETIDYALDSTGSSRRAHRHRFDFSDVSDGDLAKRLRAMASDHSDEGITHAYLIEAASRLSRRPTSSDMTMEVERVATFTEAVEAILAEEEQAADPDLTSGPRQREASDRARRIRSALEKAR